MTSYIDVKDVKSRYFTTVRIERSHGICESLNVLHLDYNPIFFISACWVGSCLSVTPTAPQCAVTSLPVVPDIDYSTINGTWYSLYTPSDANTLQSVSMRIEVIDDAHLQLDVAYSVCVRTSQYVHNCQDLLYYDNFLNSFGQYVNFRLCVYPG